MKQKTIIAIIVVIIIIFALGKLILFLKNKKEKENFINACKANNEAKFINLDCEAEWTKKKQA